MHKIIRVTTVPISLGRLLKGQLKFMSQYYEVIGISSQGGDRLAKVAEEEGVSIIPVEMTRKITPIQDLKAVYKLYKIFKKEKPSIVHSHTPKAGTLSMIAARLAGVPHRLHTIAGLPLLEATGAKRKLLNAVEKVTYNCATMIYPNSYGLKDIIIKNKFTKEDKLSVIANGSSNGIDTSFFDPNLYSKEDNLALRKEHGIHKDDVVFVFVGRLVKDKGINELVNAFKNIQQKNAQCKLLLVGIFENELDPLLPVTIKEIENNPNIIYVGWQNDVRPFFAMSDVLAFPSYREGFPNVVMQAASMSLASIVTNINGCNEIIVEEENGFIIPVKDEHVLQDRMAKLLENNQLRNNLARNARASIVNRFQNQYVWEALLKEYKSLLN